MTSMCMREATSGNTPPYCACLAACDATMLDRIVVPSATTAAAVSSQLVSIAIILGIDGILAEPVREGCVVRPKGCFAMVCQTDHREASFRTHHSLSPLPLYPLHRQHQLLRIIRHRLKLQALGVEPQAVFDADAVAALGVIQARLDGDDHAGVQPRRVGRGVRESRRLV